MVFAPIIHYLLLRQNEEQNKGVMGTYLDEHGTPAEELDLSVSRREPGSKWVWF